MIIKLHQTITTVNVIGLLIFLDILPSVFKSDWIYVDDGVVSRSFLYSGQDSNLLHSFRRWFNQWFNGGLDVQIFVRRFRQHVLL